MIVSARRPIAALFAFSGALIMVVGIAVSGAAFTPIVLPDGRMIFGLVMATIAPIAAFAVLSIVAPGFDAVLVAVAGALVAIGMSTVYRLSLATGGEGEFYAAIAVRHAMFVAFGFVALVVGVLAERGIDRSRRYPFTILAAAIAMTIVTVLLGETVNGARLWLDVGPVRFQPSEIARFLVAIFVAVFLYERRHLLAAPWSVRSLDLPPAPYLLPLVGSLLVAVGVLVFQNDLGMAALVALGAGATVVTVVRSRAAVGVAGLLLCAALLGAFLAVSRVRDRVLGWLDPWQDPAGRGYQFVQADYGLSAGNLLGGGWNLLAGNVPEVHTDLILVAVAGQFGLPVGLAVLALAGVLVCRCMLAGLRTGDGFRALAAISLAALLAIQVILIAGGSLRVLPLTGLTFPLVSYGGTSMIVTQFALGIVVGIGVGQKRTPWSSRSGLANSRRHAGAASERSSGEAAENNELNTDGASAVHRATTGGSTT